MESLSCQNATGDDSSFGGPYAPWSQTGAVKIRFFEQAWTASNRLHAGRSNPCGCAIHDTARAYGVLSVAHGRVWPSPPILGASWLQAGNICISGYDHISIWLSWHDTSWRKRATIFTISRTGYEIYAIIAITRRTRQGTQQKRQGSHENACMPNYNYTSINNPNPLISKIVLKIELY